ncbi:MAG: Kinesin-related protein 6, partial [Marteilia pararefringens]
QFDCIDDKDNKDLESERSEEDNGNLKSQKVFASISGGGSIEKVFRFDHVFDQHQTQREVYEISSQSIVRSFTKGLNGCIFAYGSTGTGKTFTLFGEEDEKIKKNIELSQIKDFEDQKGIAQRSLLEIFQIFNNQETFGDENEKEFESIELFLSIIEIYNETIYDLLCDKESNLEIFEDSEGNFNLSGMKRKQIFNYKHSLDLMKKALDQRKSSDTSINRNSSRSHCICIIDLTKFHNENSFSKSKLHLVDLAGSERVYKNSLDGKTLEEAKNINLSLHFLEHVVLALGEVDRKHIPFRNSTLTSILKSTLGSNCRTAMLATLNPLLNNIGESISTCSFAQRVALVENSSFISNKKFTPQQIIESQRRMISDLTNRLENLNKFFFQNSSSSTNDNNNNNNDE